VSAPVLLAVAFATWTAAAPAGAAAGVSGAAAGEAAGGWGAAGTKEAARVGSAATRAAIDRVLADYVGLYAKDTLPRWKTLFHPALGVAFPGDDGGIVVRDLEGFYERQRNYFATGRRISERLENVRVEEGRRIARVTADFVFVDEGAERRGRLGLHLVQDGDDAWKIVAIIFSYD
jgi:hypothetical protein